MERYKKLRLIREHLSDIPGIASCKEFDISIEIGLYEMMGTPLTLKRLILLDIASEATVRRYLNKLIENGLVVKTVNPDDSRSVLFKLSEKAHHLFQASLDRLTDLMLQQKVK